MRTRVNRASGKTLLTAGLVWACAALSLLSCAGSEGAGRIHLAGEWRLVVEKGPPGGVPDFNAPEALTIRLPGEWSSIMCGESRCASTVWLKKKVFIPKGWSSGIAVLNLGRIAVADECFFNGVMIGR